MGVKTITVTLEAYEALLRIKKPGESFSDVILRLVKRQKTLMDFASIWRDLSDDEVHSVLREIREAWSKWSIRLVE